MYINAANVSKINWTQVIAAVAMLGTVFGLEISTEAQLSIVTGIGLVSQFLTVVFRSWFTQKV